MIQIPRGNVTWYKIDIVDRHWFPTISITRTKLMTIVPPVATAVMNRPTRNALNQGENEDRMPAPACTPTAIMSGNLRPILSAAMPNTMLPSNTPNMNVACVTFANMERLHTRFHSVTIFSLKTSLLYSQFWHATIPPLSAASPTRSLV